MKKVLSIVLSVAMLMTFATAMFVTPVSAAEGDINFTADGPIVLNAAAADEEYPIWIAEETQAFIAEKPYIDLSISSDVPFDLYFADNNGKNMWGAGDFCWAFPNNAGPSSPIPAGDHYGVRIDLSGAYTWNGDPMPTDVKLTFISIIARGVGTVTVEELIQTDGIPAMKEVNLGELQYEYDTVVDLAVKDPEAWTATVPDKNGGSNPVVSADEDALYVGTDAAGWPSVYMNYTDEPIAVDANASIYADFTVSYTGATTIYLFFNGSTADDFKDGEYFAIVTDASYGHYQGYITLNEVLPEGCYDEEGNLNLTCVKIFGTDNTGANEASVTVNALDLLYTAPEDPVPPVVPGDLNGTGVVDMRDALKIFQRASNKITFTEAEEAIADMDGNGGVNMRDALAAFQKASGK